MADERGGRYFREARFFLAGDRVAAQSHILDARSLMGYMRDMHSLGGPPIQVQFATLQDGTQIRAVMMNGQYQAEIVSPSRGIQEEKKHVPTIVGRKYYITAGAGRSYAFKWQKATGAVDLPLIPGYNSAYATQASEDGAIVAGIAENYVTVDNNTSISAIALVFWDAGNIGHVVSTVVYPYMLDVQRNETARIPAFPSSAPGMYDVISRGTGHRYVSGLKHLYYSAVQTDADHMWAASMEVAQDDTETFGLMEPLDGVTPTWIYSQAHDSDDSGNVLVGEYQSAVESPGAVNRPVCVWRRPDRESPYVRTLVPGLVNVGYASVSGDGRAVLGHITQSRNAGSIIDAVPGVYTTEYGLEQLDPFWAAPDGSSPIIQAVLGTAISTAGDIACGQDVRTPQPLVRAWQRGEAAVWEPILELSNTFYGVCEHVN